MKLKRKDIIYILISVVVLVFAWIAFNIYHNTISTTISETTSIQIAPIPPTFDIQTITKLKQKEKITPAFEIKEAPLPEATKSASSITATPSANPTIQLKP